MLKIRLMRIGAKKKPFYRVVAVDERAKRTGGYLELLGTYNPLTEPKDLKLKQDRIDYWIKQGAKPSDGYLRIIGKAPQRPPRKPKKEKKESSSPSGAHSPQPGEGTQEAVNQNNSESPEKSENQNVSESENQKSDSSDKSDTSGTQSPSESSEPKS